jgi:hypothetical protein
MRALWAGVLAACWATGAQAAPPGLSWPVDCVLGQGCFIQQFVDHDPGKGAVDFACGGATYDGHKGTDIRLPTAAEMRKGVLVLAAASGRVSGRRDGMADHRLKTGKDRAAIAGRECGNGVVLMHQDGWRTQYCHMKKGSIRPKKGDWVNRGAPLGEVGLSGNTEFPHVHLSVYQGKQIIDPFQPLKVNKCSRKITESLWNSAVLANFTYQPSKVVTLGFTTEAVDFSGVMDGKYAGKPVLSSDKPLVAYGLGINLKKGDVFQVSISGPMGEFLRHQSLEMPSNKAQWMIFSGKKPPIGGWPKGAYEMRVSILRSGISISEQSKNIVIK